MLKFAKRIFEDRHIPKCNLGARAARATEGGERRGEWLVCVNLSATLFSTD